MNIRKHFALICLSHAYLGVGVTFSRLGIKAGMGLYLTISVFVSSIIFFMIIAFTSMEKVKETLFKKQDKPMFDFENEPTGLS